MKKRSRITNAQLFEAFNNPASVNGLTAGQIQNHLKSKHNRMTNITGKDVKIAIHRGVQSNAIQQKPRGRFFLCDYFCSAGSNGKSKSESKSKNPSRTDNSRSIISVRSHHVRHHNRKKAKRDQLKKKRSLSLIKKSSKSELPEDGESDSDTELPLTAVHSKHMVVDSESKRLAKRKRKLSRKKSNSEEESDDESMTIDVEDDRRLTKYKKGGFKAKRKMSNKSVSRINSVSSLTRLEAGEGQPLKLEYREDSDGSDCSDPPTRRKKSRKENQVRILEYPEPCKQKQKKLLKFEGKPVNIIEDSDDNGSEDSDNVRQTSLHRKKYVIGKDRKYCKHCRRRINKTNNQRKFVGDSEESSDEESSEEES